MRMLAGMKVDVAYVQKQLVEGTVRTGHVLRRKLLSYHRVFVVDR